MNSRHKLRELAMTSLYQHFYYKRILSSVYTITVRQMKLTRFYIR